MLVVNIVSSGGAVRGRTLRGVLLSSAFYGIGMGSFGGMAYANDASIGGVDCPACIAASGLISVPGAFSEVEINVDTAPIGAPGTPALGVGVYAYSTEEITVTAAQDITTTDRTIWLDSNSVVAGQGAITVTSSGVLTSTLSRGVEILQPAAEVLLDGQGTGAISGATDGVAFLGYLDGGTQEIRDFESIVGGTNSIYVLSLGADVSIQNIAQVGDAASAVDGIFIDALGGNIGIGDEAALGSVQGGDDGFELYTTGTGTITVNAGDVTGADWGIYAIGTEGDADITVTGAVEGTNFVGIETRTTTGDITINAADVTGGTWGIYTRSTEGDNAITVTGDVAGGSAMAIDTITTVGNVSIDGSGTATATAGDVGIWAGTTAGGSVTIQDFDTVTSVDTGLFTYSAGGDITITGVGTGGGITSTTLDGIYASTQSGDGNVVITGNGQITAADDGIETYSFGMGTMTVGADADISAVDFGIYSRSVDGDLVLTVAEGTTVSATTTTGIDATASGAGVTTIDVAADAVVEGGAFGLVTGRLANVTNAGTIQTIGDTGAADDAGTGIGLWSWTGTTAFDNSGDVLGQIHSDDGGVAFNNTADGNWYAGTGTHEFFAAADAVNNAGTIFVREGLTTFSGLETFENMDGGHVDLSYSAAATDTLTVLNLASREGSRFSFDFDAMAANNAGLGFDDSSDALGTADTIVVTGTANPETGTLVNVNHVNGAPEGLTGSVALIYTGTDLDAPDPGDQVAFSDFYAFDTALTFTTTAYHLVDDGSGGLYYQWTPNLTSATLGAYAGGDMSDPDAADTGIAAAGASFAGLGGLGATGGGVSAAIADRAASAARRGGTADVACQKDRQSNVWVQADGATTSGRNHDGNSVSTTFGYEHDLGEATGQACGQLVGGFFAGVGKTSLSWGTGASDGTNAMAGAYLRYASPKGLYASGMIAATWSETDLENGIFGSTATQSAVGYAGLASIGYVMPVGTAGSLDLRADLSSGVVDGGSFTDSAGIEVNDMQSGITTAGLSAAYWHQFDDASEGFIKAGVRWTEASREVTSFGVSIDGTSSATVGLLAAGISTAVSEQSTLDMAIQGTFTGTSSSLGGSIRFNLVF